MRYRPFGSTGSTVSNLTLSLGLESLSRGPDATKELIFAALEVGINAYRLETADPVLAEVVGQALSNVDRKLLNIGLTLGCGDGRKSSVRDFSAEGMTHAIDRALHISGLGWFDVAILQEPGHDELPQSSLNALKALRATGRVKYLGISGEALVMDTYVSTGAFDVLVTPFNVHAPWQIRSRMRVALEQDMAIMAYDYFPDSLSSLKKASSTDGAKKGFFGFGSANKRQGNDLMAGVGTFAFLHHTPHWNAEAICLAHVMTDTAVCSVMIQVEDIERLNALALIPERDMPPGLAAQIEMARIGAGTKAA